MWKKVRIGSRANFSSTPGARSARWSLPTRNTPPNSEGIRARFLPFRPYARARHGYDA